ncbi:hypothetical protein [Alkalihalobacillus alcalophilus]|nr:hypothetical protein [Alkalihalobacillus alcalophilus]
MQKNTTEYPTLKELEQLVWRKLQETFSSVMTSVLEAYDELLNEHSANGSEYMPLTSCHLISHPTLFFIINPL